MLICTHACLLAGELAAKDAELAFYKAKDARDASIRSRSGLVRTMRWSKDDSVDSEISNRFRDLKVDLEAIITPLGRIASGAEPPGPASIQLVYMSAAPLGSASELPLLCIMHLPHLLPIEPSTHAPPLLIHLP